MTQERPTGKATRRKAPEIIGGTLADDSHAVLSLASDTDDGPLQHRRTPCPECPWRKDAPRGAFPAEAFRVSATTAYDMADSMFGCHMSGAGEAHRTCAGFLLRGAQHNLLVRLAAAYERYDPETVSSAVELYEDYRSMAIANGVDPEDPAIAPCR